jgi:hypothetical protein
VWQTKGLQEGVFALLDESGLDFADYKGLDFFGGSKEAATG